MLQTHRQHIDRAVELSREMLELAGEENWEELARLERERSRELPRGFNESLPASMREFALEAIRQIQQCDKRIVELAEQSKQQAHIALAAIRRGKKATKQYKELRIES